MFKIICDVKTINLLDIEKFLPKGRVAPAVKKHGIVIGYKNCEACDVGDIKLTSTSKNPSIASVNYILNIWNSNILNPTNQNYYEAYEDILNQDSKKSFNPENLKFISLFTEDTGLTSPALAEVLQVFEAIIDITVPQTAHSFLHGASYKTGYKEYHEKSSFLEVTNSTHNTFITFGTLKDHSDYKYINSGVVAYLLRNKGALDCKEVKYGHTVHDEYFVYEGEIYNSYRSNDFQQYLKFLEKDFIEKLNTELSSIRQCKVGGKAVALIDPYAGEELSNADFIKTLCIQLDGEFQSIYETIDTLCNEKDATYQLSGNNIFSITCSNYKSLINFDDEGEILGAKITDTYNKNELTHDEL